jgi:hypothetical protein
MLEIGAQINWAGLLHKEILKEVEALEEVGLSYQICAQGSIKPRGKPPKSSVWSHGRTKGNTKEGK